MADVEIVRIELYADENVREISMTISDAIAWLVELKSEVPPEFQNSAFFEIEHVNGWDDYSTAVRVFYDRPITGAEIAEREAKAEADRIRALAYQKERDLATYEALKAKLGIP